jgi:hypothetical protein
LCHDQTLPHGEPPNGQPDSDPTQSAGCTGAGSAVNLKIRVVDSGGKHGGRYDLPQMWGTDYGLSRIGRALAVTPLAPI